MEEEKTQPINYCSTEFKMSKIIFDKFHKNLRKNFVKHHKSYMSDIRN